MELSLFDQDFLETLYKAAEKSQYVDDIELFKKQAEHKERKLNKHIND